MTVAICISCGERKFGAFVGCKGCGFRPTSEEELAKSMMVTDHYFSTEQLDEIARDWNSGKPVRFDPGNVSQFVEMVRKQQTRKMLGLEQSAKPKKPWWKLI
jgi:hypothetical protein